MDGEVLVNLTIPSPDLKRLVKTLSAVKAETTVLDTVHGQLYSFTNDIEVLTKSVMLEASDAMELDTPVVVSSKQLQSTVSKTSGPVEISVLDSVVIIKSKRSTFELPTLRTKYSFPTIPSLGYEIPLSELIDVLTYAATASIQSERHNFTGAIQLQVGDNKLSAVGTDHKRLAIGEAPVTVNDIYSLICPVVVVDSVKRLVGGCVRVGQTHSQIIIQAPQVTIIGRKMVKPFPLYAQLLPEANTVFTFDGEALKEAVDQVSPTASDDDGGIRRLHLSFRENGLRLRTGEGSAKSEAWCDCKPQQAFEYILNYVALADFCGQLQGPVTMTASDEFKPVLFTSGNHKLLVSRLK